MPELMKKNRSTPVMVGVPEAAHLLRRVGLGYNERDAKQIVGLPLSTAIEKLLWLPDDESVVTPAWVRNPVVRHRAAADPLTQKGRAELDADDVEREIDEGARWWMGNMLATRNPVRERMTLFWHAHFPSSWRKVGSAPMMLRQNMKWRMHALGNFSDFACEMVTDPAMLVYLDAGRSTSRALDERFARTLLEVFLLGNGFYFDWDVKDAARALTGLTARANDPKEESFRFMPAMHDPGRKTIFGKIGHFNYTDLLRLILEHDLCAAHIARSVAKELVGPDVDEAAVQQYARAFRRGKYEIRALLRAILQSPEFWDPDHRGTVVKSPALLTVEVARGFGVPKESADLLVRASREMGQGLFDPPGVRGWPGGKSWLGPRALDVRRSFVGRAMEAGTAMFPSVVLEAAQKDALAKVHMAVPVDVSWMNGSSQGLFMQDLLGSKEFQVA